MDSEDEVARDGAGSGHLLAESLRQSQEQFETLVANVRDYAIFLLDARGRVISWNAGARELKGYAADEILGRHFSIFYSQEDIDRGWPARELAIATAEGHFEDEGWRVRKDGSRFWASVVITALEHEGGGARGFIKITRDLTERRLAEERLRRAHDELEERVQARTAELERANQRLRESKRRLELSDRRKDQFLAVLSHELRNPLAPVRTAIELLHRADVHDPMLRKAVDILGRQVSHMTRLVDDLLDVSRITSGKVQLERVPVDLSALLHAVVGDHRAAAEASGLVMTLDLPTEPIVVRGDEVRLAQAFTNVLANSMKFTPRGGSIRVRLTRARDDAAVVVTDTGVGIRAEMLGQVFEPFTQDDGGASAAAGGLGLGLALVRSLVEMHGGTVEAASAGRNEGSTFTFRFPLAEPSSRDAPAPPETNVSDVSRAILVIEDNADAADTLAMFLTTIGHRVEVAYTGREGLRKAREHLPDVVICDIGLNDMSGLDVAPRLRDIVPDAYLIASTGYGQDEDRRRTREAGFHLHLTKPMDPSHLERVIEERLRPEGR